MESSSSTSGSSKRARAPTGGNQVVSCLVDGCRSDLSKCRDYHRRHKVCELHSKTPKVTIGGREQRFCQQCSRFHSLGEFDEGKRSCRKRLEGHNRRRRKPQPDSLPVKPSNFLSSARGSRFLPFSSSPVIPASSVVNSSWSGAVKSENSPGVYSSHMQIDMLGAHRSVPDSSYSHPFRGRQFPFLQGLSSALHGSSSSTASGNGGSNNQNQNHNHNHHQHHPNDFSSGGLNQGIDSALSLLSSSPAETPETGLSRMVQANHAVPQVRGPSLISGLHYNSIGQISSSCPQLQGSDLMPNSSNLHHCQDVYQTGNDGSCSVSGPQQTLSFLWE